MNKYYNATFMTFNIRTETPNDAEVNQWANRRDAFCTYLLESDASVICMQEVKEGQNNDITAGISNRYDVIWYGRDNTEGTRGEGLSIAYDRGVWTLIDKSFFFLSETPDAVSKGWDASHRRICVYAILEHRETGERIGVFNVHLDVSGIVARENGIKLVLEKIDEYEYPSFLCGDFNCTSEEIAYKLSADAMLDVQMSAPESDGGATYNGWGNVSDNDERKQIDFCFVSREGIEPLKFEICRDRWGERSENFLSDHYALKAVLKIKN